MEDFSHVDDKGRARMVDVDQEQLDREHDHQRQGDQPNVQPEAVPRARHGRYPPRITCQITDMPGPNHATRPRWASMTAPAPIDRNGP